MCEGTVDENFPALIKDTAPQIQVLLIPSGISRKETIHRHITVKLLKIKDEQTI